MLVRRVKADWVELHRRTRRNATIDALWREEDAEPLKRLPWRDEAFRRLPWLERAWKQARRPPGQWFEARRHYTIARFIGWLTAKPRPIQPHPPYRVAMGEKITALSTDQRQFQDLAEAQELAYQFPIYEIVDSWGQVIEQQPQEPVERPLGLSMAEAIDVLCDPPEGFPDGSIDRRGRDYGGLDGRVLRETSAMVRKWVGEVNADEVRRSLAWVRRQQSGSQLKGERPRPRRRRD